MRPAGDSRQRTITRSLAAPVPQYKGLRARLTSEPRLQPSSRYGPVPFTSVTIGWVPVFSGSMCEVSQPASLMANAGAAILERNATSGLHSSNTTVSRSFAVIRLRLPV